MNSFLPDDYEAPSGGNYMKLQPGENRIRILASAIVGTVVWTEDSEGRRPHRFRQHDPIPSMPNQRDKPKHFWAFPVWSREQVQVLEITQRTIQDAILSLVESSDWGDPRQYDIIIKKSGSGMDTEYAVIPAPKSPTPTDAQRAYLEADLNMDALFDGGDPFAGGSTPAGKAPATSSSDAGKSGETKTTIREVMPKEVNGATVYKLVTNQGDYWTDSDALYRKAGGMVGEDGATVRWQVNSKGGKVVLDVIAPVAVGESAGDHNPLDEESIPF